MKSIYGIHPVLEALKNDRQIDKIFLNSSLTSSSNIQEIISVAKEKRIAVKWVPQEKLHRMVKGNHQGVVATIAEVETFVLEDIFMSFPTSSVFLMLDGITDVRNFGAIVRTAECAGVAAMIIPTEGAAPLSEDAAKTSSGALYRMKICKSANLLHTAEFIQQHGGCVLVADEKASESVFEFQPVAFPILLVMGSEERGVSKSISKIANHRLKIPMRGEIGSLNVAVATGIMLFELLRK